jgi:polyisoprenoid-binding protein YceI
MALRHLAAVVLVMASIWGTIPSARASDWTVDMDKSRLGFIATQSGAEFVGRFHKFGAKVTFSPDDLENSVVDVEIDMLSVDTQSGDRDRDIATSDWFHSDAFPTARFYADHFVHIGDSRYEAHARLTMRDVGRDVILPFQLLIVDSPDRPGAKQATVTGKLDLLRNSWGIGQGQWADTGTVGGTVVVKVDLVATSQD